MRLERTEWNHNPDEIHEEIVHPKVVRLRAAVRSVMNVVIEQAGRIVQSIAIEVAHAHDDLQWMAQRMLRKGQVCDQITERAPKKLFQYFSNGVADGAKEDNEQGSLQPRVHLRP